MSLLQIKECTSQQLLLLTLKTGFKKERIQEIIEAITHLMNLEMEANKACDNNIEDPYTQLGIGDKMDAVILKYKLPNRTDSDKIKDKFLVIWQEIKKSNKEFIEKNKLENLLEDNMEDFSIEHSYSINPEFAKVWKELRNQNSN